MRKGVGKNGETYAIKYAIFNTTFYLHLTDFYNSPIDAALFNIIPLGCNIYRTKKGITMIYYCKKEVIILSDNLVDACVEMILKLNELDLL